MPTYVLCHSHAAAECRRTYAAWRGFDSPLRHRPAFASCAQGGHRIWWTAEADSEHEALALLPAYVAERTEIDQVKEVTIR